MRGDNTITGATLSFDGPRLAFGDGVRERLPAVLERYGADSLLVVTDAGVAETGILDDVLAPVDAATTRYDAATEPGTDDFEDLPEGPFDAVLAVGGGSVLDTAKVAALLLAHGGAPADYLGVGAVPGPTVPVIAVPTTSGTGSQSTQTAVLAHEGIKRGASDEFLRPAAALVDPELTVDLPPGVTARSGFDAFVHALESLLARDYRWVPDRPIDYQGANPVSRTLARRALALVWGGLEPAVHDGANLAARRRLALGSHLAGLAFSNSGLGMVHALASTVGGLTDAPHGDCLAVSIEAGLAYNRPVRRDAYADLARGLGLAGGQPARADDGHDDAAAADALLAGCRRIRDAIGLPGSFEAVGLGPDDVPAMVENTLVQDRRLATNPRAVDPDALEATLTAAFG